MKGQDDIAYIINLVSALLDAIMQILNLADLFLSIIGRLGLLPAEEG